MNEIFLVILVSVRQEDELTSLLLTGVGGRSTSSQALSPAVCSLSSCPDGTLFLTLTDIGLGAAPVGEQDSAIEIRELNTE